MPTGQMVLAFVEAVEGGLTPTAAEVLGLGQRLATESGAQVGAVLLGSGLESLAQELAPLGADRVYVGDDQSLASYEGEAYLRFAEAAVAEAKPGIVLLSQTLNGRDLAARLAFRLGAGLATDCTNLRLEADELVMTKPVYGGNALAEYVVDGDGPVIATLRPRSSEPAAPQAGRSAEVVRLSVADPGGRPRVVDTVREVATSGPRLKDAKIVVSGGRGLGGPENWHFVEELAEPLGAAVGATRAVTDAGWVPTSLQVGLTGITITPDLYITIAVSGAVQHIAGCSGSRNIVAINKDPEANIFKHARYGVVGDWKQVMPAFTAKVKELRSS